MKVFLATKNKGKIRDFETITEGLELEILTNFDGIETPDVVEDGETFEENSQKKALEIAKFLNMATVSDDSGLCVDALDGAPGVYSARFAEKGATDKQRNEKLLKVMKDVKKEDRKAHFVSVVSIAFPNGEVHSFRGEVEGEILFEERGNNGFGFNPVFYSTELKKTFGEATDEERKKVSHRARAFRKLLESGFLEKE